MKPDEVLARAAAAPVRHRGTVVVSGVASDSHTWNLVFLQLVIEELGYTVVNLGPCVPDEVLVERTTALLPELLVLSSVNGHGYQDGLRVVRALRAAPELVATPMVIGGKLDISAEFDPRRVAELAEAGFDAVFPDNGGGLAAFRRFVDTFPAAPRLTTDSGLPG
ncbi:cobalamin B12-binding domain-containing protein [Amycolatopsis samaneae]